MKRGFLIVSVLAILFLASCVPQTYTFGNDSVSEEKKLLGEQQSNSFSPQTMEGTFRCWSYNVAGAGKQCTSPPLVLSGDGSYSMSSEVGTYTIVNNSLLVLSESKLRGVGVILEGGMQVRFEYDYNGWHHTVTYLRMENSPVPDSATAKSSDAYVEVSLIMHFPDGGYVGGINTATLIPRGGSEQVAQSIVYESAPNTVTANFRKGGTKSGVPTGAVYDVFVSTGFEEWKSASLDLTNVTSDVSLDVQAVFATYDDSSSGENSTSTDSTDSSSTPTSSSSTPCDPNLPLYTQKGCVSQ